MLLYNHINNKRNVNLYSVCVKINSLLTPVLTVLSVELLKNAYITQMLSEVTEHFTNSVRLNCNTN